MLRTLYAKLAFVSLVLFVGIGAVVVYAFDRMLEGRLFELAALLAVGGLAFALAAGLSVFGALTRRLTRLVEAMESFGQGGFRVAVQQSGWRPGGDEIDRLGIAFNQLSLRMSEQVRELERSDEHRRELLANVSHDLRTPLTSIRGYLETLLVKEGSLAPEERHAFLQVACRHSEHLAQLVGDLFQLTKLEADEIRPQPEAFSLAELAQDVAQKFRLRAQGAGVRIDVRLGEALPPAFADIGLVERLLDNLLDNAIRHTPDGGAVGIDVGVDSGRLRVRVTDTGCGIAEADLPRVFERYYRAARHCSGREAGTGLGLAIARRIVMLHGGEITVESRVGQGTTFAFDLPPLDSHGAVQ